MQAYRCTRSLKPREQTGVANAGDRRADSEEHEDDHEDDPLMPTEIVDSGKVELPILIGLGSRHEQPAPLRRAAPRFTTQTRRLGHLSLAGSSSILSISRAVGLE